MVFVRPLNVKDVDMGKRHYIRNTTSDATPNRVITAYAAMIDVYQDDKPHPTERVLGSVASLRQITKKDRPPHLTGVHFHHGQHWREWLLGQLLNGTCTWLLMHNAYEQLTLLGFWELFEKNDLILDGRDPFAAGITDEKARKGLKGYFVHEPPLFCLFARCTATGGTIKVLDVRNFGMDRLRDMSTEGEAEKLDVATGLHVRDACNTLAYLGATWIHRFWDQYTALIKKLGLGMVCNTAASQAMFGFRRSYLKCDILVHDDFGAEALEEASYFGGRCECFHIGKISMGMPHPEGVNDEWDCREERHTFGPIYHLDFNQLYSYVAHQFRMPCVLDRHYAGMSVSDLEVTAGRQLCIADVEICTTAPAYPVRLDSMVDLSAIAEMLGTQKQNDVRKGEVLYPVGRFRTTLCSPELLHALSEGRVTHCHGVVTYQSGNPFVEWASTLYAERLLQRAAGRRAMENVCKKIALSLYGKFGQLGRRWVDDPDEYALHPFSSWLRWSEEDGQLVRYRSFAWNVQRLVESGRSANSVVALSAFIASAGRILLWNAIELAWRDNVYYCDTDSIWCNQQGYNRLHRAGLISPAALGGLKVVAQHREVEIRGIKHYIADGEITCAGVPSSAVRTGERKAQWIEQERLMSALGEKRSPQSRLSERVWRDKQIYRHGRIWESGTVSPWEFGSELC